MDVYWLGSGFGLVLQEIGGGRMKFTITRHNWGIGKLLDEYGKRCVIGQCLSQMGWQDFELKSQSYPVEVMCDEPDGIFTYQDDNGEIFHSTLTDKAIHINDLESPRATRRNKERALSGLFAKYGHVLEFVD